MIPIFIMSSERSGSNLLRKMLGMHRELADPPPPHTWRHLTNALPEYGSLTVPENLRRFVEAAVDMTQVPESHLRWKYEVSVDDILYRLSTTTPTAVFSALYSEYARREGASGWVCKENNLFDHAFQIRDTLPDARFLYLCRDGRDVACSMKKVPTHDEHSFFIAREWKREQRKCLRVYQTFQNRGFAHLIRYEDLIERPEAELRKICEFLDLDFQERMLYFHESEEARREAERTEYWENLSRPVMSDNKGKFYDQLTGEEVRVFESVAANELNMLGYPLATEEQVRGLSRLQRVRFRLENRIRRYFQSWDSEEEEGRRERSQMLSRIYNPSRSDPPSFATPLTYEANTR